MSEPPDPLSRPSHDGTASTVTVRQSFGWKLGALIALALGVAGALIAWHWTADAKPREQVQVLQSLPQSDAAKTATTSAVVTPFGQGRGDPSNPPQPAVDAAATPRAAVAPPAPVTSPPPGVSAQQWQALVAEWSAKPDGAREIARLDEYYRFVDTVHQLRELNEARPGDPKPALLALARKVDGELDRHVALGEIGTQEARDIKATVLELLEPDPEVADDKLERWARTLPQATDKDPRAMQRDTEFQHRRDALVRAWSSLPLQQRDLKVLERDIQALQNEIYGPGGR